MISTWSSRLTTPLALTIGLTAAPAVAQPIEDAGVRALGMGGAFVAAVDDTTAVYWNPAALAKGPLFGAVVEGLQSDLDPADDPIAPDTSARWSTLIAVGIPSLGVSYRRSHLARAPAAAADAGSNRDDRTAAGVSSLTTHQVGATILQSLGDHLVVGTTLKWVRGVAAAGPVDHRAANHARLDAAASRPGKSTNAFDLDAGVLAVVGAVRLGLVARNLRAPQFSAADGTVLGLEKQVRAGMAVPAAAGVLVAADVDLRRTTDLDGLRRRRLAVGTEGRVNARLVLRGGISLAIKGGTRTTASGGASVAVGRLWLEGQLTGGERGQTGWSLGIRLDY